MPVGDTFRQRGGILPQEDVHARAVSVRLPAENDKLHTLRQVAVRPNTEADKEIQSITEVPILVTWQTTKMTLWKDTGKTHAV